MTHSPLTTRFALTTDHSSRNGTRVDSIGHHHTASTSLEGALSTFQPGGREVSPNYCIEGRNIVLVVDEDRRAWTSGSYADDARSITYEIVNSTGSPDWRFSAETIASVVALDIDICRRYGITPKWGMPGLWQHKNLYQWFGRSYATACAGPSFPQDYIVTAVSMGLAGAAPSPTIEGDDMILIQASDDPKNRPWRLLGPGYNRVVPAAHVETLKAAASKVMIVNAAQYDMITANFVQSSVGADTPVTTKPTTIDQAQLDAAIAKALEGYQPPPAEIDYAALAKAVNDDAAARMAS